MMRQLKQLIAKWRAADDAFSRHLDKGVDPTEGYEAYAKRRDDLRNERDTARFLVCLQVRSAIQLGDLIENPAAPAERRPGDCP